MNLKSILCAAAMAAAVVFPAAAGDQEDATNQCITIASGAALQAGMPAEQAEMVKTAITSMCTCMTDKVSGMGDDGAKVLRVLAKTTPEMAQASTGDPAADRKNAISIMVAEYGMSEDEAGATYDRVDPQMKAAVEQCQAEAMKAMTPAPAQ